MPKYKTVTPVRHNGTRLPPGSALDLSGPDADQLLALGAIVVDTGQASNAPPPAAPTPQAPAKPATPAKAAGKAKK